MGTREPRSSSRGTRARHTTYSAVTLLTTTALLATMASTSSGASAFDQAGTDARIARHDTNIVQQGDNSEYEYLQWRDVVRESSRPDVQVDSYFFSEKEPREERKCYGSARIDVNYLNDSTRRQRRVMQSTVTAAIDGQRLAGAGSSTPKWDGSGGTYKINYLSKRASSNPSLCPDYIKTFAFSRQGTRTAKVSEDLEFMYTYATITALGIVSAVVGSYIGAALVTNPITARGAGFVVGCLTGALGQMVIKAINGREWVSTLKRAAIACVADGTAGLIGVIHGAWVASQERVILAYRHMITDSLLSQEAYRYLPDDIEMAGTVVERILRRRAG